MNQPLLMAALSGTIAALVAVAGAAWAYTRERRHAHAEREEAKRDAATSSVLTALQGMMVIPLLHRRLRIVTAYLELYRATLDFIDVHGEHHPHVAKWLGTQVGLIANDLRNFLRFRHFSPRVGAKLATRATRTEVDLRLWKMRDHSDDWFARQVEGTRP